VDGLVERGVGVPHGERVVVGDGAAGHRDGVERDVRVLDKAAQGGLGARPPDTGAGDDDGAAGVAEKANGGFDIGHGRGRGRGGDGRDVGAGLKKQVDGNGEVDRAFAAGIGDAVRALEIARDLGGSGGLGGPFADGPGHRDLVDVLEGLAVGHRARAAAADGDQGAGGELGSRDAGEGVGVARSAGHEGEGGLAVKARPGVGGVGDAGFVAEVDDADSGAGGLGEDFVEMVANEGEKRIDPQLCARPHERRGSVLHRKAMLLH
jgi:hypothetical protein